jgi:hypothetical protein
MKRKRVLDDKTVDKMILDGDRIHVSEEKMLPQCK